MEFITSLLKEKKAGSLPVAACFDLQTRKKLLLLLVLRLSKITVFIKTTLLLFIHTDVTFTCQDLVIINRDSIFNCHLMSQ